MLFATLIFYLSLFMVLTFFEPSNAGWQGFALFYISLGLSLIGTLTLIGLLVRVFFSRETLVVKDVLISLRQGILFTVLIIVALILKGLDLLMWWNILLLIGALTLLEIFLMSYKSRNNL